MSTTTPGEEISRPDWVCQRAVAWALDDAPVPADMLGTLIAIARRCWIDGTGSYQSKPTLAKKTGKSKDQVDADVKKLLELGLIRLGDQTLPERNKVPAGQRPVVYDVALELRGPKPARAARNKTGKNKANQPTPGMDAGGGMDTRGGTDTPGAGGMDTGGTRGMDTSPTPGMDTPQRTLGKNPPKKTSKNPSLSDAHTSVPAPREPEPKDGERDDSASPEDQNLTPQQQLVTDAGCPPHLAAQVVDWIERNHPTGIQGIGWWRRVARTGDLPGIVREAVAAITLPAGDRDRQPRTSQRGEVALRVNGEFGSHTAGWERRRSSEADKAAGWLALGADEQTRWDHNQRIIDHQSEATR